MQITNFHEEKKGGRFLTVLVTACGSCLFVMIILLKKFLPTNTLESLQVKMIFHVLLSFFIHKFTSSFSGWCVLCSSSYWYYLNSFWVSLNQFLRLDDVKVVHYYYLFFLYNKLLLLHIFSKLNFISPIDYLA